MILLFRSLLLTTLICLSFSTHANDIFQTKNLLLVETTDESDNEVQELVKALSMARGDAQNSRKIGNQILDLVSSEKDISSYDYLWTLYSLILNGGPELDGGMVVEDYLKVTDTALNFLDYNGVGEWQFTDEGQFKMEVYRQAANGAAWALRSAKPKAALDYIALGLEYMRGGDNWLLDTKVRILLNLDDNDQAYTIVKAVLEEDPDFGDFQDFKSDKNYLQWLKDN